MGSLHYLQTPAAAHARLLQQLVSEAIATHPDSEVAARWSALAADTLARYPAPPMPTESVLDLDTIEGLDPQQRQAVCRLLEHWLDNYFNDVRQQLMSVHRDFLSLQRQLAELEVQRDIENRTQD